MGRFDWKDEDLVRSIIKSSGSLREILAKMGISPKGASNNTLKKYAKLYDVELPKNGNSHGHSKKSIPLDKILVESSTYSNTCNLKKKLISAALLKEECLMCGLGASWNGLPLSLQLDHINGNPRDNRLENLRLLCPNCHTQTGTWGCKSRHGG